MNPSAVDSIRRADAGRRGGVRVRGGRLPPIRIRDSALISPANKKVVAPKIPQRRIKIKEEPHSSYGDEQPDINRRQRDSRDSHERNSRGRGRGMRGPKVYVQSEGTFLGEGPANKIKRESQTADYERSSRGSGSRGKTENNTFDAERLKYLMENYDVDETYFEGGEFLVPVRFPIVKQEIKQEIKTDIKDEIKTEIKEETKEEPLREMVEIDGVKLFIKKEPEDFPAEKCDPDIVNKLKNITISKPETSDSPDLKFLKEEDVFLFLQLPSCLPFLKSKQTSSEDAPSKITQKTNGEPETEDIPKVRLEDMSEGHIGKLQILKSGAMRLVSGSVKMAVDSSMEVTTFCDIVSISTGDGEEADTTVIGTVDQKLVLRPLFSESTKETGEKEVVF